MQNQPLTSVFLSYAREDDEPFVRRLYKDLITEGFHVWFDRESMPSRQLTFHQEIKDAIRECDKLVFVVGPKAANSDYVCEEWKFALELDKHVIPILRIGDFDNLPTEFGPELNLGLLHCDDFRDDSHYKPSILKLLENIKSPPPPIGFLYAVPDLPPHFQKRSDLLMRVRDALLVDLQKPAVITGADSRVGLQGMGGIGKSVLAAALARDRIIRRSYPDGIIWVSVGQQPNLVLLLNDVARHMGNHEPFDSMAKGQGILKKILQDKRVFLVLDDVWSAPDALVFNVLGPRCRALITTRDAGIINTLEGTLHRVDLFDELQSLQLLADAIGIDREALPMEANEVVKECGNLPLALDLCGGMAKKRDGDWSGILERLQNADLDKIHDRQAINKQHESIWQAMQASIDMLDLEEQQRFAELSVFPSDRTIPEATVGILWHHTGNLDDWDTEELLINLYERSLIRFNRLKNEDNDKPKILISLHDLLHDFATRMTEDKVSLHQSLLNAYNRICRNNWSSGPDDGYFFTELAGHFIQAGHSEDLADLLFEFNWIQIKTDKSIVLDLIQDYNLAKKTLPLKHHLHYSLELLQSCLMLSSHIITQNPKLLAGQLIGRMDDYRDINIRKVLDEAKKSKKYPWLKPLFASLKEPDSVCLRILYGHINSVLSVAISPNAKRVISGSSDHTMKIWDLESGLEIRSLLHEDWIHALAVTPDGKLIISASDKILKIWNLDSGAEIGTLKGHEGWIGSVVISPDGKKVISASYDNSIKVWSIKTGQEILTIRGHSKQINSIVITPNGKNLISASKDLSLKVWDIETGFEIRTIIGHISSPDSVDISPDGKRLISASHTEIITWDLDRGIKLSEISTWGVESMVAMPDGKRVITGHERGLKIWRS